MRVQRDIPAHLIVAGVKKSNLRQLVEKKMADMGIRCRCIRCREVGLRMLKTKRRPDPERFKIISQEYEASDGKEIFVSAVDEESDTLAGYIRLRIPSSDAHRPEIQGKNAGIVRELRVCGPMIPVGGEDRDAYQHKGLGGKLLSEAERKTVKLYNRRKILITSAIGTREYYKALGYTRDGPYMSKPVGD